MHDLKVTKSITFCMTSLAVYWILFAEVDMISMMEVPRRKPNYEKKCWSCYDEIVSVVLELEWSWAECEKGFVGDDDVMRVIHGVSLETGVPISNNGLLFIDDIHK